MSNRGEDAAAQQCDGSHECEAEVHVHGCFVDEGNCDEPAEHYDVEGVMA